MCVCVRGKGVQIADQSKGESRRDSVIESCSLPSCSLVVQPWITFSVDHRIFQ